MTLGDWQLFWHEHRKQPVLDPRDIGEIWNPSTDTFKGVVVDGMLVGEINNLEVGDVVAVSRMWSGQHIA